MPGKRKSRCKRSAKITLATAIINLLAAILLILEKLLEVLKT